MKFPSLFVVLHAVVARGAGFFAVDFVGISSDFGFSVRVRQYRGRS